MNSVHLNKGTKLGPVGVDLDNTIVSYDEVLFKLAANMGLINADVHQSKKAIRDSIRALSGGEILWQKLQAEIYGPMMPYAQLNPGVEDFFRECQKRSVDVYIISHKTQYANYDTTKTNLWDAALNWLNEKGFFNANHMGMLPEKVFFEISREDKIARIRETGCTYFIDDLEETFTGDGFPQEVIKILFDPHRMHQESEKFLRYSSWLHINQYFFPSYDTRTRKL